MKKIISVLLSTLMVLAIFASCLTASAAEARNPQFNAADSMLIDVPQQEDKDRLGTKYVFYALTGGMQANNALMDKKYESALRESDGKIFNISAANTTNTIDINGVYKENGYSGVLTFKLAEGVKTSVIITAPAPDQPNGDSVPNALDFYACDDYWAECKKDTYNTPVTPDESYNHTFVPVLSLTDLADKWLLSADRSYVYYEVNFTTTFINDYLAVAFPAGTSDSGKFYLYEIAVFSTEVSEIPGLRSADVTTAAPETTQAPETTKKAETTQKPVETKNPAATTAAPAATTVAPAETTQKAEEKGCGSVAAIGVAVIVTVLGAAYVSKKH